MMPEWGTLALAVAVVLALWSSVLGLAPLRWSESMSLALIRQSTYGVWLALTVAFAVLIHALVTHDFSVVYVAKNSNTELPVMYCVAAAWGAHEGSLLLWALLLSVWAVLVWNGSHALPSRLRLRVLGVLGLVQLGFLLFTLLTSSPFERAVVAPTEGADLNPILQDPALALHPPLLYMGYVGTAVAFAFAVAAMLGGQLDQRFARWARPWVLASWVSLTLGITLGSFWAYYELGWGGWWFWDPVENASFMPWLAATALIHSLAVTEKRGLFTQWTLLLSILTFSLSLLGTFLVRSGVLVSVHSFAADPTRGLFILGLLVFYIVGALLVYALKGQALKQSGGFTETSRESFLLFNNALLVTTALLILLGTLWPLILEVFKWGQISVGPPYFNVAFMIPMLPLVFLVSVGAHAAWKYGALARRQRVLGALALVALVGGSLLALSYHAPISLLTVSGFWAGLLVIFSSAYLWWNEFRSETGVKSAALGMVIAHIGIGVFTIGVSGVSSFAIEKDVSLGVHDAVPLADYTVQFLGTHPVKGPNYDGVGGAFVVLRDATVLAQLETQKRVFHAGGSAMTHAAIHSGGGYDLFLALGEDVGQGKWSVRLQYKPLVRLIWWGGVLMALGGLWALWFRAREGRA